MRGQTVLILGGGVGGVGGVVAANALRRRLDRRHRIVVVDREPTFALAASFLPDHQITRAEVGRVTFTDGTTVDFDLLVHVPPIAPPLALRGSRVVDETGWVRVDRHSLETAYPGVYAVGDVTLIPLAMGKPLPRAGVFAHAQAEAVARNIAASVAGKERAARFDGRGACFVETGDGRAGFGSGDFYAEPRPAVRMRRPAWYWHAGKVLFEKQVMWGWL